MLSCKDLERSASDYLEGELGWRGRMQVRLHLLMCKHCHRYVRQLKAVIGALGLSARQPKSDRAGEEAAIRLLLAFRQQPGE